MRIRAPRRTTLCVQPPCVQQQRLRMPWGFGMMVVNGGDADMLVTQVGR